jgi:hypothetical protein
MVDAFTLPDLSQDAILFGISVGGNQAQNRRADHLRGAVAVDRLGTGVPAGDRAGQVFADDGVDRALDNRGQAAGGVCRALLIGDLGDDDHDQRHRAAHLGGLVFDRVETVTGGRSPAQFVGHALAREHPIELGSNLFVVDIRHHILHALIHDLRRAQAEKVGKGGVGVDITTFGVDHDQADARVVGHDAQPRLAVDQPAGLPAQLQLRHRLPAQRAQRVLLRVRQLSGHSVHHAERAEHLVVRRDQRRAA